MRGAIAKQGEAIAPLLLAAYSATKSAVVAFSESLRQEVYRDKIRVTVIEPGIVATELFDGITDPIARARLKDWVASIKPLESADVAAAILYAVTQPVHVSVNEILLRPTEE